MKLWVIFPLALLSVVEPIYPSGFSDIHRSGSGGNGVMVTEFKLGSPEAKLGAKIASVTSGHNVTCFDCEVMISPLFRWPNSVCHYNIPSGNKLSSLIVLFFYSYSKLLLKLMVRCSLIAAF